MDNARYANARENLFDMLPFGQRSNDARNTLFDAALGFGKNWRRDVVSLAEERLLDLNQEERTALVSEIEDARTSIEDWIMRRWEDRGGEWAKSDAEAARGFIRVNYLWMDDRNAAHAVSQGTYYAWHG